MGLKRLPVSQGVVVNEVMQVKYLLALALALSGNVVGQLLLFSLFFDYFGNTFSPAMLLSITILVFC